MHLENEKQSQFLEKSESSNLSVSQFGRALRKSLLHFFSYTITSKLAQAFYNVEHRLINNSHIYHVSKMHSSIGTSKGAGKDRQVSSLGDGGCGK